MKNKKRQPERVVFFNFLMELLTGFVRSAYLRDGIVNGSERQR